MCRIIRLGMPETAMSKTEGAYDSVNGSKQELRFIKGRLYTTVPEIASYAVNGSNFIQFLETF